MRSARGVPCPQGGLPVEGRACEPTVLIARAVRWARPTRDRETFVQGAQVAWVRKGEAAGLSDPPNPTRTSFSQAN